MKSAVKVTLGLFFLVIITSCQENPDPEPQIEELEVFQRFDNPMFNYQNSNVTRIKTIEDRLFYTNRTNPGYIDANLNIEPLCCLRNNQFDFRQSLSKEYVVAVDRSMSGYNVYNVISRSNPGYLNLNILVGNQDEKVKVSDIFNHGNFDINEKMMLVNVRRENSPNFELYIFDLEKNTNFFGTYDPEVKKVEIPNIENGNTGARIFKVDSFKDGWIASIHTDESNVSPNYFISKEGFVQRISISDDQNVVYSGHQFTSDGKLIANMNRSIYISESGNLEDLRPIAAFNNNFRMRLIQDRVVIWNINFAVMFEIENYNSDDPSSINIRMLNNEGIEFSGLNELQVFQEKVFAATSQGLFTKSLEGFWDSAPEVEEENSQAKAFLEGVEFNLN